MRRWLSKEERDKRDKIVVRLHDEGVPHNQIAGQFHRSEEWVRLRLRKMEAINDKLAGKPV